MHTARALPMPTGPFFAFPPSPAPAPCRRRTTQEQGRALEILAHAIEYLVDSHLLSQWETPGDAEAVHLLMGCSRAVFASCELLPPWHQRVQKAVARRLHLHALPQRS